MAVWRVFAVATDREIRILRERCGQVKIASLKPAIPAFVMTQTAGTWEPARGPVIKFPPGQE